MICVVRAGRRNGPFAFCSPASLFLVANFDIVKDVLLRKLINNKKKHSELSSVRRLHCVFLMQQVLHKHAVKENFRGKKKSGMYLFFFKLHS